MERIVRRACSNAGLFKGNVISQIFYEADLNEFSTSPFGLSTKKLPLALTASKGAGYDPFGLGVQFSRLAASPW
ncbi:MAG: hypothetical protein ACM3US_03550 [Sphingomonadaceae bacterium]